MILDKISIGIYKILHPDVPVVRKKPKTTAVPKLPPTPAIPSYLEQTRAYENSIQRAQEYALEQQLSQYRQNTQVNNLQRLAQSQNDLAQALANQQLGSPLGGAGGSLRQGGGGGGGWGSSTIRASGASMSASMLDDVYDWPAAEKPKKKEPSLKEYLKASLSDGKE